MKNSHVFEIVWEYVSDDTESHRTLVECSSTSSLAAIHRFRRHYRFLHSNCRLPHEIISVTYLGSLVKKCW